MTVISALNWALLAFGPVFVVHLALVSPARDTTIKYVVEPSKKGSGKTMTNKTEVIESTRLDYDVAWNAMIGYVVATVAKVTTQAILLPLILGSNESAA